MSSRFLQVFLGVSLAIIILMAGGGAIAFLMMSRMLGTPPKPMFANDYPPKPVPVQAKAKKATKPSPTPTSPTPTASPSSKPSLEPGAYEARVTWSEGLTLRDSPSYDAASVGGIDYNTPVVVLEESSDGVWQRIRVTDTGEEGWVKAGNVEQSSGGGTSNPP
jgi:hypothetical protein